MRERNSGLDRVFKVLVFSVLTLVTITVIPVSGQLAIHPTRNSVVHPNTYYVSKSGDNSDGRSWNTAWDELDQINWKRIEPGDTILIDGGSRAMMYTTELRVGASGTPTSPIGIRLASETGRNGQVVIFGGRERPLPYCEQQSYVYETDGVRRVGIALEDQSWIVIDGRKWHGITIYGHNRFGILFSNASEHITVRNVEVYDNGSAIQSDGRWYPYHGYPGVRLAGSNMTFERAIIHDNGGDAFQSRKGDNHIHDFVLKRSWLYNSRIHPTVNESFNYCVHTDGIQIYDGGTLSGVTIEESIIGPGFTQGVLLGQTKAESGAEAIVNDVTLRDSLFVKAAGIDVMGHRNVKSTGWVIDHVTMHCLTPYTGICLWLEGQDHTITDSIIIGSKIRLPDGLDHYSGNCQWNTTGFQLGQIVEPQFSSVDDTAPFSLDDYSLLPSSPCRGKGSGITSVEQLLRLSTDDVRPFAE